MNTKNNARSRSSRQVLRQALLKLLNTQELPDITTAQLCREAGVNRSTFYAHYRNIWELLDELETEMDRSLLAQFQWVQDAQTAMLDQKSFLIMTRHIAAHPAFFRARLNNTSLQTGRFQVGMEFIMEQVIKPYARSLNDTPLLPYYMAFGRAGVFEVLRIWIDTGCEVTAEEIAQLLFDMTVAPFTDKRKTEGQ